MNPEQQNDCNSGAHSIKLAYICATPVIPSIGAAVLTPLMISSADLLLALRGLELLMLFGAAILLMAFGLVPTAWVALVGGYVFGAAAVIYLSVANLFAAALGRIFALTVLNESDRRQMVCSNRWAMLTKRVEGRASYFVFYCRLSPVLPFALTNVLLSLVPISAGRHAFVSVLGMMPRTCLAVLGGTLGSKLLEGAPKEVSISSVAVLLYVSGWGIWRVLRTRSNDTKAR